VTLLFSIAVRNVGCDHLTVLGNVQGKYYSTRQEYAHSVTHKQLCNIFFSMLTEEERGKERERERERERREEDRF
jgi:hypothetical protein